MVLSRLHATPPAGLERWFAAQGKPARCDLARSGAEPRSIAELLEHAGAGARDELLGLSLDYGDPWGGIRLRQAIVASGAARSVDEVLVTTGAAEALLLAAAASIQPGDRVRVATPAYEGLTRAMAATGATLEPVTVWRARATALDPARLLTGGPYRAVVVNSPHNPTGLRWPPAVLDSMAAHVAGGGGRLVVDEVARGTLDPGARSVTTLSSFATGAVIAIGDVSKAFGLGGLRIGWLTCADPEVVRRAARHKDLTSLAPAAPSQLLAALAIEQRASLLRRVTADAAANRATLQRWVAGIDGARCASPVDGLVAFPGLPGETDDAVLSDRLRSVHHVGVVPGSLFGRPGHIRVGLGSAPDAFAAGLSATTLVLRSLCATRGARAA